MRPRQSGDPGAMEFPIRSSSSPSSRSRRPTRRRWAGARPAGQEGPRRSRRRPTRRSARPIMKGMGELHLEIIVDPCAASSRSRPTSARRRSPIARRSPAGRDRLHPQEADRRFGPVRPRQAGVRAGEPGGFEFESKIVGGSVPKEYIPGVEKGLEAVARNRRSRRLPGDRLQRSR